MKRVLAVAATAVALVSSPAPAFAAASELRPVALPFLWSKAELLDVTADGAGGVWIGGAQGRYCLRWADYCPVYSAGNPVVRRRVGSSWKEYPINGWTGQGQIRQIASSAGQTWITGGSDRNSYVARFDGSAFQKVAIPIDQNDTLTMLATSPAGTFIARWVPDPAQRLLKRTGDTWTAVETPGIDVLDLQGLSATDAWAVGSQNDPGSMPAVAHYDGTAWKQVPLPAETGPGWFLKVVPVATDDVWAIMQKRLLHWNGSAWTLVALPAGLPDLTDLAVDASGTPWIAAYHSAPYRYSGGTWEKVTVPAGATVHDLAAVPGSVWGTGEQGENPAAFNGS
ncbi:beta propeller repeat protein [Actinomadura macrotermitis]|uniref:Secreted protein n=1 Tax=Actinomadura macrotermitis TaxID=2585200 RepID=A0A7K0C2K6_9ACTN|nr:hypothetical protein [Actinomadura macrotermitis]MQY07352.1 hypothetical protein [Actinomadura macrotermitis]